VVSTWVLNKVNVFVNFSFGQVDRNRMKTHRRKKGGERCSGVVARGLTRAGRYSLCLYRIADCCVAEWLC
jgi:hypothetical protein